MTTESGFGAQTTSVISSFKIHISGATSASTITHTPRAQTTPCASKYVSSALSGSVVVVVVFSVSVSVAVDSLRRTSCTDDDFVGINFDVDFDGLIKLIVVRLLFLPDAENGAVVVVVVVVVVGIWKASIPLLLVGETVTSKIVAAITIDDIRDDDVAVRRRRGD